MSNKIDNQKSRSTPARRASRSSPIGRCSTCRKNFCRERPRQRKCPGCWRRSTFQCADCGKCYVRDGDCRVCPKCLAKVEKQFPRLVPKRSLAGTDPKTNALLVKTGNSMERGQNIDVAGGLAKNKRVLLASDLIHYDQRGDDALDREWAENAQDRIEHADLPPDNDAAFCPVTLPREQWLGVAGVELERKLKRINWFLTTPTGIVERQTGWHRQKITRYRKALAGFVDDLGLRIETAKTIDAAITEQTAAKKRQRASKLVLRMSRTITPIFNDLQSCSAPEGL
jgi:hypothetical protein